MVEKSKVKGFTLLELIIAIAIFSVIAYLAFGGVRQISKQGKLVIDKTNEFSDLQIAIAIIENDFLQILPRPVRDQDGNFLGAMQTGVDSIVEFSRGGVQAEKFAQAAISRVAYILDDGKLYRKTWNNLDRAIGDTGLQKLILDKVKAFKIEFLGRQAWTNQWPEFTNNPNSGINISLPRLIRIGITQDGRGEVIRVIPGTSDIQPTGSQPPGRQTGT